MASTPDIQQIKIWNVNALKDFCRKKGLKVIGNKDELVARVFAGLEQQIPDARTAKEELLDKAKSYQSLLCCGDSTKLPDPFSVLKTGWQGEEVGRHSWPNTMYGDMCAYFHKFSGGINTSITKRVLNDYKEGKAYSYFDSQWLKEVLYHPISESSKYCFLKAQCTPSQRVSHTLHDIWISIVKDGGEIISAYCTCFAGLGSTCNHIAAVLFKMDYYWRQGLTNKSCTDVPCSWNKYGSDKTVLKPTLAKDLKWRKPCFGKRKPPVAERKIENSEPFTFEEMKKELMPVCPNAVVFQGHKNVSPNDVFHTEVSTSAPRPLCEMLNMMTSVSEIQSVLDSYNSDDIDLIEKETRGQCDNELWGLHRKYRITSSLVHDVYTRVNSLNSLKRGTDVSSLLKRLMTTSTLNYKKVPQLKYGIEMEAEAKSFYHKLMNSKGHSSLSVSDVGLFIFKEKPQYGSSPDGLVSCFCCGTGLLEIKCPMSISHDCPSESNLPYLIKGDSETCSLKKSHRYYSQIQWQMGVCYKEWCDFFIYTRHGYHLERIGFDLEHFNSLIVNCDLFYSKYVIPSILDKDVQSSITHKVNVGSKTSDIGPTQSADIPNDVSANGDDSPYIKNQKPCKPANKKRKTGQRSMPLYTCSVCSEICVDDIESQDGFSVLCDKCLLWFHFNCVGYQDTGKDDAEWYCPDCV